MLDNKFLLILVMTVVVGMVAVATHRYYLSTNPPILKLSEVRTDLKVSSCFYEIEGHKYIAFKFDEYSIGGLLHSASCSNPNHNK